MTPLRARCMIRLGLDPKTSSVLTRRDNQLRHPTVPVIVGENLAKLNYEHQNQVHFSLLCPRQKKIYFALPNQAMRRERSSHIDNAFTSNGLVHD